MDDKIIDLPREENGRFGHGSDDQYDRSDEILRDKVRSSKSRGVEVAYLVVSRHKNAL